MYRRCGERDGLLLALSRFDWPVFAVAVMLAGSFPAGALIGLMPMLYVLVCNRLLRSASDAMTYRTFTGHDVVLMLAATAGVGAVIVSQGGAWAPNGGALTICGMVGAVASAGLAACSAGRLTVGQRASLLKLLRILCGHVSTEPLR